MPYMDDNSVNPLSYLRLSQIIECLQMNNLFAANTWFSPYEIRKGFLKQASSNIATELSRHSGRLGDTVTRE